MALLDSGMRHTSNTKCTVGVQYTLKRRIGICTVLLRFNSSHSTYLGDKEWNKVGVTILERVLAFEQTGFVGGCRYGACHAAGMLCAKVGMTDMLLW